MKNFSAKNAEFETLKINNEAAISSADLGTAPNQIPLNKDLGSLAYQDAVNLDDVSADMLELRAIAAEISDSAVDVFVYDTSRDSDGGAWRKRTQHTSWYNETLNTATRGGRREFPAVAVIVAEADKVTIYDGDDPDLSMWMVFEALGENFAYGNLSSLSMVNSRLAITTKDSASGNWMRGLKTLDFISEIGFSYDSPTNTSTDPNQVHKKGYYRGLVIDRNSGNGFDATIIDIVNHRVNDVAMTILPNAPIDEDTGLPVPTIAVATDGGVSVIKDDGGVVDLNVLSRPYSSVYFSGNMVWAVENPETDYDLLRYFEIPTSDITTALSYGPNSSPALFPENTKGNIFDSFNYGSPIGITKLDHEGSMVAYTTSKYNTGWMPGDTKLATLSDTTVETIGVNSDDLLTGDNSTFDSSVGDWTSHRGAVLGVDTSRLKITPSNALPYSGARLQLSNLNIGTRYEFKVQYTAGDNNDPVYIDVDEEGDVTTTFNNQTSISQDGYSSYYFTATQSTMHLYIRYSDLGNTDIFYIDNISVRATTELITNGDFSNGTTGWTEISNPSLTVTNGKLNLKCLSGDNQAGIHQNFLANDPSRKYTLSFDIDSFTGDTAANLVVGVDDYWNNTSLGSTELFSIKESGSYSFTFNGRSGGMSILFRIYDTTGACSEDTSINIDNISVRPAVEDRSVNNNGLQIVGAINKTPVAPGADLVAYSGFSDNNYLMQPYNEDLDFGTGDFSIALWFNFSAGVEDQKWDDLFSLGDLGYQGTSNASSFIHAQLNTVSNYLDLYIGGFSTADKIASIGNLSRDTWNHVVFSRKNGIAAAFINGSQYASKSNDKSIGGAGIEQYDLRIGYTGDNYVENGVGFPANYSKIALFRISATAPTDAQIAKIYRDEKALFTDGAQATLYGTSDAVTALAYDEKTELLHVGTASGRSDFSGLRRINNTTTAITTSISAHNNLIAEQ